MFGAHSRGKCQEYKHSYGLSSLRGEQPKALHEMARVSGVLDRIKWNLLEGRVLTCVVVNKGRIVCLFFFYSVWSVPFYLLISENHSWMSD